MSHEEIEKKLLNRARNYKEGADIFLSGYHEATMHAVEGNYEGDSILPLYFVTELQEILELLTLKYELQD